MEHGLEWRYLFQFASQARDCALATRIYHDASTFIPSPSSLLLTLSFSSTSSTFTSPPPFPLCFLKTAEHVPSFQNQASRQSAFRLCLFPSLFLCHCQFLVTRIVQSHSFFSGAPVTPL